MQRKKSYMENELQIMASWVDRAAEAELLATAEETAKSTGDAFGEIKRSAGVALDDIKRSAGGALSDLKRKFPQ